MKENWPKAYSLVRTSEGGNDDDPADSGGRTSRGITQREYNAWRAEKHLPFQDVWKASEDEIKQIYYEEYWQPLGDILPAGIDYAYYDMAVNAGPYRAAVLLQRALRVAEDGRIGPVTRGAIRSADPATLINRFADVKNRYYRSISTIRDNRKFLNGWLNRVVFVKRNALAMLPTTGATA